MKRRLWSKGLARIAPMPILGGALSSLILIVVSLGLLIYSGVNPSGMGGLRSGTADLFAPALSAVSKPLQEAASFVRDVTGIAALQAENASLKEENARLRDWYQAAQLLEAENRSLRDLLNVKIEAVHTYITTRVIGDGGSTFVKSLLLSGGQEDGIRKNQAVLSGEGLIGRIVEAGDNSSRVLLLTDINSRVPILVEDSRQHAILAGTNEDMPVLVHMPPDSEIADGARIMTSGHGGMFPQGLPVGRVVKGEDGKIRIKLYADMNRLMHVRVVNLPDDPNLRRNAADF